MIKKVLNILFLFLLFLSCGEDKDEHLFEFDKKNGAKIFPSTGSFFFVGIHNSNSSIYKYNFGKKKSSLFWHDKKQRVIDLSVSDDFKTAFFVAVNRYGTAGSFTFIENANLYRIDPETEEITFLKDLGNLIQIYSYWSEEGNYNLITNAFDPKINTYVIQNTLLYNRFGRLLSDHSETSDLLISGYPIFKLKEIRNISYNKRYRIFNTADSLFIRNQISKEKDLIKITDHKINEVEWITDRSILVFTTVKSGADAKTTSKYNASLNIFDLNVKKNIKSFTGSSLYRFTITNDFLIFDEGFAGNSKIHIIDLNNLNEFDTIRIKGGCGLRNVPLNPF